MVRQPMSSDAPIRKQGAASSRIAVAALAISIAGGLLLLLWSSTAFQSWRLNRKYEGKEVGVVLDENRIAFTDVELVDEPPFVLSRLEMPFKLGLRRCSITIMITSDTAITSRSRQWDEQAVREAVVGFIHISDLSSPEALVRELTE